MSVKVPKRKELKRKRSASTEKNMKKEKIEGKVKYILIDSSEEEIESESSEEEEVDDIISIFLIILI